MPNFEGSSTPQRLNEVIRSRAEALDHVRFLDMKAYAQEVGRITRASTFLDNENASTSSLSVMSYEAIDVKMAGDDIVEQIGV